MAEALESKDGPTPADVLTRLLQSGLNQISSDYLNGALSLLLPAYFKLRSMGKIPRFKDAEVDTFMHQHRNLILAEIETGLSNRNPKVYARISWIASVLNEHRGAHIRCRLVDSAGKSVL